MVRLYYIDTGLPSKLIDPGIYGLNEETINDICSQTVRKNSELPMFNNIQLNGTVSKIPYWFDNSTVNDSGLYGS